MEDREQISNKESKKIGFGDATVHELKTLLTAIIVSAELLVEELQSTHGSMPLRLTPNIRASSFISLPSLVNCLIISRFRIIFSQCCLPPGCS